MTARAWNVGLGHEMAASALKITPETWQAYRSAFRALGPRHKAVDRWRHDLKWSVPESVVAGWLAPERANLVAEAGHA